ncbi:hypothetical protein ACWNS2_05035 [Planococcus plakortidis]
MKKIALYSLAGVAAASAVSALFLRSYAPLGATPNKVQRGHGPGGKFANLEQADMNISVSAGLSMLKDSVFAGEVQRRPAGSLPLANID